MNKAIAIIVLCFLIIGCGTPKESLKLKTVKTKDFTIEYPDTWIKSVSGFGSINLIPKKIKKTVNELNYLSINNNIIFLEKSDEVENKLIEFSEYTYKWQKNKVFKISKINSNSLFLYKIESVFETNFDKKTYKKIEYFYTFKNKKYINYISFQMQEDLYNKYIHQALFIINSLKLKNIK